MSEPRIRLKLSYAQTLLTFLQRDVVTTGAVWKATRELDRAVSAHVFCRTLAKAWTPPPQKFPKPSRPESERKRNEKHGTKARRTMDVYDAVRLRAGAMCECGCMRPFNDGLALDSMPNLDDYFGGAKHRNARECWYIRADCHRDKTANRPSKAEWLRKFIGHCERYGFTVERRRALDKLEALEAIARAREEVRRVVR